MFSVHSKGRIDSLGPFKAILISIGGVYQVAVNDREVGERNTNNSKFMAFLYFPKKFTRHLVKYIDDRDSFDDESQIFAHLTKESE